MNTQTGKMGGGVVRARCGENVLLVFANATVLLVSLSAVCHCVKN